MNRNLGEQIIAGSVAGGLVSAGLGAMATVAASEAIERDHTLIDQATRLPEVPITFDDGIARSGQEAMNTLTDSLAVHKEVLTIGEVILGVGAGALVFAAVCGVVRHLRNLGPRGYVQRSLER